jgi:DNA-binding transcriptional LysR family regulator
VEAFGADLQLSLVARGIGLGVVTPHVLQRSPYRKALRVVDVPGFDGRLNVWLAHGALPGRLLRPVALLQEALAELLADRSAQPAPSLPA